MALGYGQADRWWREMRRWRRQERRLFRAEGRAYPKLRTICCVDLDAIVAPAWMVAKAIPGFELTESRIWLGRMLARELERLDRECGGNPRVTPVYYRRCPLCRRPLLGEEAVARWQTDKSLTGRQVPCGPDCLERAKDGRTKSGKRGRQKDGGTGGVAVGRVVRHCQEDERAA